MGCPHGQEWVIIALVVVVVLGMGRLPQLGDALGRSIRNFRRSFRGDDEADVTPVPPAEIEAKGAEALPDTEKPSSDRHKS